jgi:hypothetical protein
LTASPEVLAFFRELVHIVEYGCLAFLAARLLEGEIGGWLLYFTVLAYALIVGTADEMLQWLHAFRVGDPRDVITNGVSASSGLLYHAGLSSVMPRRSTTRGRRLATTLLALSPLIVTEFYLQTQRGHRICDRSRVCFLSNFSEVELAAQAAERRVRWADIPVGALSAEEPRLWALEDYFLTEARAHFRIAVDAANVDDWETACAELHILKTRFSPSIPAIGVRLQDYPCRREPENFDSRVFNHLASDVRPARWRALAALAGLALALWTGIGSQAWMR